MAQSTHSRRETDLRAKDTWPLMLITEVSKAELRPTRKHHNRGTVRSYFTLVTFFEMEGLRSRAMKAPEPKEERELNPNKGTERPKNTSSLPRTDHGSLSRKMM